MQVDHQQMLSWPKFDCERAMHDNLSTLKNLASSVLSCVCHNHEDSKGGRLYWQLPDISTAALPYALPYALRPYKAAAYPRTTTCDLRLSMSVPYGSCNSNGRTHSIHAPPPPYAAAPPPLAPR